VNINNSVKWRRFIVPKEVVKINNYLLIDTYKSNKIKIGMIGIRVNYSEVSMI